MRWQGVTFSSTLVIVQFSISVLLIVGTVIIMNQMNYMKHKHWDMTRHKVCDPLTNDTFTHMNAFKTDLEMKWYCFGVDDVG